MARKYLEIEAPTSGQTLAERSTVPMLQREVRSVAEALAQKDALLTGDYAGGTAYFHLCHNEERKPCVRFVLT